MIDPLTYNKVSELRYSPWGETRDTIGAPTTDRKYTGQREDSYINLYWYGSRWYDPALSHFIMADTIIPGADNPQAWDRYAYVKNNPTRYTDPTGHCPICVFAVFVAAAIILPWITSDTADPQELATITPEQTLTEMGQAADLSMLIIGLGLGVTEVYYVGGQTLGNVKPRLALSSDDGELPNVAENPANFAKPSKNNSLPNDALVCRAGTCEAERFGTPGADGKLIDVSTSSHPGKTVGELSQPFPNNQVGVTTVGAVRAAGGDVIMSASRDNRYHATLFGITPEHDVESEQTNKYSKIGMMDDVQVFVSGSIIIITEES